MITYHRELTQGSDDWLAARCGLITASEMKLLLTPTLKVAGNQDQRAHINELAAQRITQFVEPHYISSDMLRGQEDEIEARALYAKHYAPVEEVGFVTTDALGFTMGYSPDGLVGDDGLLECKSRRAKYQVETVVGGVVPSEYLLQIQTGLLITQRKWLDFVSISAGLPLFVQRVYPDPEMQSAIAAAATSAEQAILKRIADYQIAVRFTPLYIPTERRVEMEICI